MNRVVALLGLGATVLGSWVLTRAYARETTCHSFSTQFGTGTASAGCARVVSTYFTGAALTMGGAVILTLALFVIVSHARRRTWGEGLPTVPGQRQRAIGSLSR